MRSVEVVNQVLDCKPEEIVTQENSIKNNELNEIEEAKTNVEIQQENTNCLALTVQKEYKLTVAKNIMRKSLRYSWKIALSIITINFLNTFL